MAEQSPHVVIVGAGFGGLCAARSLARAPLRVTVIDKQNHHLFQPLLYQVATASLNPSDIAAPIRHILWRQRNVEVLLSEVTGIDCKARKVSHSCGELDYDYLVLAAGATHSYFGHDQWQASAPGLKTIAEALELRRRFLMAFERAELETDPEVRRAELTFVIIGGGPTGVELAGAIAEIARRALPRDFRKIDTTTARVILIEASDRLLGAYSEALSARARRDLETLGVDVWLSSRVTAIDERGVEIGDERIVSRNVIWAAGIGASPLGAQLGAETDRMGRVKVGADLSLSGHPEVFVIGDLARVMDRKRGVEVPGIAPAAMQMGRYVGRLISTEVRRSAEGASAGDDKSRRPFQYSDKGMLATIGRARAVGTVGRFQFAGWFAWVVWLVVHIFYLIGFRNRVVVLINWAWAYVKFERGARLISDPEMSTLPGAVEAKRAREQRAGEVVRSEQ